MNNKIGHMMCPLCDWPVMVRENKRSLSYFSCDNCQVQVQTRGADSDQILRRKMKPITDPDQVPDKLKEAETAPTSQPAPKPEPKPEPAGGQDDDWDI
ncbi:MAG: hypothetical protein OQL08_01460 [Gammaproteobacteria bacterium]|nr:hypothetical protein [Gammaproteobacteria bacterium]